MERPLLFKNGEIISLSNSRQQRRHSSQNLISPLPSTAVITFNGMKRRQRISKTEGNIVQ